MFDFSIFRVRRQQTPKELRIGGGLLVVLGLFIGAGATLLGWALLELPIPAHWLPAGMRIERRPAGEGPSDLQWAGIAALTLCLLVFGTVSVLQGLLQLVLGRQSKALLRIMIVIGILFVVAGVVASVMLGRPIGRVGQ
ncbi:MAG: hypothetical protein Q8L22_02640 [Reyranella sp.]|nr:hypothetical protein [Reyranella sp.]